MESVKSIYFIGIGGARLNALAKLYADRGYRISGSDRQESKATKELIARGIPVTYGHDPADIGDVDLVVYTNAVGDENPQLLSAKQRGIPVLEGSQLLGRLMDEVGDGIAVSGTHGKTTTTSMLALILTKAGVDPTVLIGGDLSAIGGNHRTGHSPYIVVEACEFRRSFLQLAPKMMVVTNVDWDHPDCFPTPEAVVEVFRQFIAKLPEDGFLVLNGDDPHTPELRNVNKAPIMTFGFNTSCDLRAINLTPDTEELGSRFQLVFGEGNPIDFVLHVPGRHNVYNAMAAVAIARQLGVDPRVAAEILREFRGVRRRFEIKGQTDGILVVDDYAHHPAAVATTLAAARNHFNGRIWCVFQPHLYSRTRYLLDEFSKAFTHCDILILDDIYAAREKDPGDVSSRLLAEKTREHHRDVRYLGGKSEIINHLIANTKPGDLVITMGAGDVFKIGEAFLAEKSRVVNARS
jgi:UDP-N-acetylmuramate--alanine ligase